MSLQIAEMQWSRLSHINAVEPIGEADADCLNEIQQVLAKHGRLSRFGVTLIHNHFEIHDNEILLETTDEAKREHWVRPVKRAAIEAAGQDVQTTVVTFDESGYAQGCTCLRSSNGHEGRHGRF